MLEHSTHIGDACVALRPTPPPPRFAWSPSPASRGRIRKFVLAAHMRPSFAQSLPPPRSGAPVFYSVSRYRNEGKRNAERRRYCTAPRERMLPLVREGHPAALARRGPRFGRGAPQRRGRSPLGVPPRLSPVGRDLLAQLQAMLPGTWRERTILWTANRGEDRTRLHGRYHAPACPSPGSQHPHRP